MRNNFLKLLFCYFIQYEIYICEIEQKEFQEIEIVEVLGDGYKEKPKLDYAELNNYVQKRLTAPKNYWEY